MPETPKLRQQANNQTQAGAAAQLVVNIFLVTTKDGTMLVKPIAFHMDGDVSPPTSSAEQARGQGGGGVDVEMEAGRRSNAQGQGLTVVNDLSLPKVLGRAMAVAALDPDITKALKEEGR